MQQRDDVIMDERRADPETTGEKAAKDITTAVYALQAASFLIGITFIVAVIINYLKRDVVRGTWLESHFDWQINTFWFCLLWTVVGLVTLIVGLGLVILPATYIWVIYRIVKGWLRLAEYKPMYTAA